MAEQRNFCPQGQAIWHSSQTYRLKSTSTYPREIQKLAVNCFSLPRYHHS
jgi:hypothetical protein